MGGVKKVQDFNMQLSDFQSWFPKLAEMTKFNFKIVTKQLIERHCCTQHVGKHAPLLLGLC